MHSFGLYYHHHFQHIIIKKSINLRFIVIMFDLLKAMFIKKIQKCTNKTCKMLKIMLNIRWLYTILVHVYTTCIIRSKL